MLQIKFSKIRLQKRIREGKGEKDSDIRNFLPMLRLLVDSLAAQDRGKVFLDTILPDPIYGNTLGMLLLLL